MRNEKIKNVVGEKYGEWTILSRVGYSKNGQLRVLARCSCGNEKEVYYFHLKNGDSLKCQECHRNIRLENLQFGRWTVLKQGSRNKYREKRWLCKCSCGIIKEVAQTKLLNGNSKSCGCYKKDLHRQEWITHNMSHTRIFNEWMHMKNRCSKTAECKDRYYDRGIKVCEDWETNFQSFFDYVSKLPNYGKEKYSLDRIDNNGNYEPGNVRWADSFQQNRNKNNNLIIMYRGEEKCLSEWVQELGTLPYTTIWGRLKRGWDVELAFETPPLR